MAVGILVELGVGDWESLSLLNNVTDQEAVTFLSFLMVNPGGLKGQQLRDCDAFQRLAQQAAANAEVPQDRRAYIPVLSPAEFNAELEKSLDGNLDNAPLRFKKMADEVLGEFHARFGDDGVPAHLKFEEVVTGANLFAVLCGENRIPGRATPETLKARLRADARGEVAKRFFVAALKPMLKRFGLPEGVATGMVNDICRRHPNSL